MSDAGICLFIDVNVWWRCTQYFVISSCARDHRCVYMEHVYFYVRCSDCVEVCGDVCCVVGVAKDRVFNLGMVMYVVSLCRRCEGWVFLCLNCEEL